MHNLKKALIASIAFLLVTAVMSIGLMEFYFRSEEDFYQDGSERAAYAGSLDYLICGASHAYRGMNPEKIDALLGTSGYNISGGLMTMGGRYEMLRIEIERNPVKTVVLELSYATMTRNRVEEGPEGDLYVLGRMDRFWDRFCYFFRGFRISELPEVYERFLTEGIDALGKALNGELRRSDTQRFRGYIPTGPRTIELETNYEERFHSKTPEKEFDPYNLKYLERILTYCEERDIEVVFVTMPLTKTFLSTYAELDYFYDWYRELAQAHGCRYYDFNLLKEKDEMFPDPVAFYDVLHLNDEGAETLSNLFAELELRTAAGEDVSGLFYSSYLEMESAPGFLEPWPEDLAEDSTGT
ncbi:MAG: hypothetical protein E7464_00365 [Ruminococcaceae bacterium]|nr:hypothetical protein [Oscillospiraceae bacterium]